MIWTTPEHLDLTNKTTTLHPTTAKYTLFSNTHNLFTKKLYDGLDGKESTCNAGDLSLIPELGRSPGGDHGNPCQYSCLENPLGQKSLEGYSPWGCKELNTTERLGKTWDTQYIGKTTPWKRKRIHVGSLTEALDKLGWRFRSPDFRGL